MVEVQLMTSGSKSWCRILTSGGKAFCHCPLVSQAVYKLPLSTLRTSADARTAADAIWQRIIASHLYTPSERMLPLPIFLTSADGRIVADDVPQDMAGAQRTWLQWAFRFVLRMSG